ncbi:flavodoxin [Clostridioides mangenotii]|uniref:flavodoxin n=1 Tax=Metaclostridioides mangenotii TaxID=1540 RepID=UPI001C118D1C|nr:MULTISPECIES: flavodoxin [Clostridioides]MBS5787763.1 flavodoxin [Clostridioides difficile]MBU5306914.1 flavodoxin [Clostridioides mangenotii]MCR1954915.1 flavodoxin [Clostridioides mangenotii]
MKIVYWSGTGNTETMAKLIASGIEESGKKAEVISVSDANPDIFDDEEIVILGCSAMGDEVLEEGEFEPFIDSIASKVANKKVALFGSYGWGDGQWMREWQDRMSGYGAILIDDGLIVNEDPDAEGSEKCKEFGRDIAK